MRSVLLLMMMAASGCNDDQPKAPKLREPPEAPRVQPAPTATRMDDQPATVASSSSEPSPPTASVAKSQCFKAAKKLFKQAKGCGLDIGDRTVEKTCTELITGEGFDDQQAVKRLAVFTSDGCTTLRTAIDGDRI